MFSVLSLFVSALFLALSATTFAPQSACIQLHLFSPIFSGLGPDISRPLLSRPLIRADSYHPQISLLPHPASLQHLPTLTLYLSTPRPFPSIYVNLMSGNASYLFILLSTVVHTLTPTTPPITHPSSIPPPFPLHPSISPHFIFHSLP